jgi:hypothetical protein
MHGAEAAVLTPIAVRQLRRSLNGSTGPLTTLAQFFGWETAIATRKIDVVPLNYVQQRMEIGPQPTWGHVATPREADRNNASSM